MQGGQTGCSIAIVGVKLFTAKNRAIVHFLKLSRFFLYNGIICSSAFVRLTLRSASVISAFSYQAWQVCLPVLPPLFKSLSPLGGHVAVLDLLLHVEPGREEPLQDAPLRVRQVAVAARVKLPEEQVHHAPVVVHAQLLQEGATDLAGYIERDERERRGTVELQKCTLFRDTLGNRNDLILLCFRGIFFFISQWFATSSTTVLV